MSNTDGDTKPSSQNNDYPDSVKEFDDFLKNNQHIFVLIGVFGSVSVYLSNIDVEQPANEIPITDITMFSGLGISFLLCGVIIYKIGYRTISMNETVLKFENILFVCFGLLFTWFISVIFGLLTEYQNVFGVLLIMAAMFGGVIIPIALAIKAEELGVNKYFRLSSSVFIFTYSVILFYMFAFLNQALLTNYNVMSLDLAQANALPEQFYFTLIHVFVIFTGGSFGLLAFGSGLYILIKSARWFLTIVWKRISFHLYQ
ncbi:hypothetical protein [Natrononativus amylolyticus]|uniref:hypothetical protein n=1 Tax=Natrononativus amylolyticus TaxID=2963434 RepID=UPI0020CC3DA2|nr:hypothetical protein [Natrononativus amylolyticus]